MSKEANNEAAMREALVDVYNTLDKLQPYSLHINDISIRRAFCSGLCHAKNVIDAALAKPPRNCDVGTAEEHTERFKQLCRKYRRGPGPRANCKGCPVSHESQHVGCTFAWAQMPYESDT